MLVSCFAKVNLYLNVSEKQKTGFHLIQSVFQNISLFDTLEIQSSKEFSLSLSPDSSPFAFEHTLEKDNLIERVYQYFKQSFDISPVKVLLEKHIPIGAGLGGGSADAAGMILGLDKMYHLNLSEAELIKCAETFGSDIPFFIKGGTAKVTGRGEILENLNFSPKNPLYYVLIFPGVPISTKEAYLENVTLNLSESVDSFIDTLLKVAEEEKSMIELKSIAYNAFQAKTIEKYAKIKQAIQSLADDFGCALLSGSGSSVFSVFTDKEIAKKVYENAKKDYTYTYMLKNEEQGILIK